MRSLVLVTGPTAEPITVSEAKTWARIDGATDDALVGQLIGVATAAAQEYLRRSLITQTWKLTLDLEGSGLDAWLGEGVYDLPVTALNGALPNVVPLPKGPVQSITSVVTYDTDDDSSTFASTNYRVDSSGDRLVLTYGSLWPSDMRQQSAAEITYVAGYGDTPSSIPQPIKTALMIHVATLYEQRGMCEDPGPPAAAKALLNQYRVMDYRG